MVPGRIGGRFSVALQNGQFADCMPVMYPAAANSISTMRSTPQSELMHFVGIVSCMKIVYRCASHPAPMYRLCTVYFQNAAKPENSANHVFNKLWRVNTGLKSDPLLQHQSETQLNLQLRGFAVRRGQIKDAFECVPADLCLRTMIYDYLQLLII